MSVFHLAAVVTFILNQHPFLSKPEQIDCFGLIPAFPFLNLNPLHVKHLCRTLGTDQQEKTLVDMHCLWTGLCMVLHVKGPVEYPATSTSNKPNECWVGRLTTFWVSVTQVDPDLATFPNSNQRLPSDSAATRRKLTYSTQKSLWCQENRYRHRMPACLCSGGSSRFIRSMADSKCLLKRTS